MSIDFRANQIRVEKIISSGSSIIIYPSGAASDLAGTINTTIFPQTGFGSDVFLFVSGGVTRGGTSRNASLFGGILVSSGAIYGLAGFSGSLTKLTDGSSYLIASSGINIVTNSNGSITISTSGSLGNSFSFNSTSIAFSGSNGLTGSSNFIFNDNSYTLKIFEAEDGVEISKNRIKVSDPISEIGQKTLYIDGANAVVSGAGGGIQITAGNSGYLDLIPNGGGAITITAGSGSAVNTTFIQMGGTGGNITLAPGAGGPSIGTARGGQGGSLILNGNNGGDSISGIGGGGSNIYITAGTAGSGSGGSGLGGNIEITTGQPYYDFSAADSGYLKLNVGYRTLSTSLSSASIRIDSDGYARNIIFGFDHVSVGGIPDSYFIVSGSPTRNALFMSDVVSSGSIKAISGFSGSLTKLIDGTSYLVATGAIGISTQSNGSIVISASSGGSSLPAGTNGGVLAYSGSNWVSTNSGSIFTPLVASGSGLPFYSSKISPIYVGTGYDSTIDLNTAILLGSTVGRIKQEVAPNTYSDAYKFSSAYHIFGGSAPGAYLNGTKIVYKSGGVFIVENGEGSGIYPIEINGSTFTLGNNGSVVSINAGTDYFRFNDVPVAVYDTLNTTVINVLTLYHKIGFATPAAGVGTRLTFANSNSSQVKTDSFYIDSIFVTASAGQQYNKTIFYSTSGSYMGDWAPESKVLEFTADEFVFGKKPVIHFNGPIRTENYNITGSAYTLNPLVDSGSIRLTNTGSRTITLPASSSVLSKFFGCEWRIHDAARTADSGNITITAPSGVTLNSVLTSSVVLFTKGSAVLVRLISSNDWETIGI